MWTLPLSAKDSCEPCLQPELAKLQGLRTSPHKTALTSDTSCKFEEVPLVHSIEGLKFTENYYIHGYSLLQGKDPS